MNPAFHVLLSLQVGTEQLSRRPWQLFLSDTDLHTQPWAHLEQPTEQQEQPPHRDKRGRSEAMLASPGLTPKKYLSGACLVINEQGLT